MRENEDGGNFYEVYYFNFDDRKGSVVKDMVEVGVNVNIVDEHLESKGKLVEHHDQQELHTHATKMPKQKPNYSIQVIT